MPLSAACIPISLATSSLLYIQKAFLYITFQSCNTMPDVHVHHFLVPNRFLMTAILHYRIHVKLTSHRCRLVTNLWFVYGVFYLLVPPSDLFSAHSGKSRCSTTLYSSYIHYGSYCRKTDTFFTKKMLTRVNNFLANLKNYFVKLFLKPIKKYGTY